MINLNQVDDDLNNLAKTSLNQKQNVVPAAGGPVTNVASLNSASGSLPNPGPAGFGGVNQAGRRTYNPLARLSSYTYNLTLYMLTPNAFAQFVDSGRTKINAVADINFTGNDTIKEGAFIVAQSGGINNGKDYPARAPGMELDYFIDNLKFQSTCSTQANGVSSALNTNITFDIIEPYGFSFLTQLRKATAALQKVAKDTSWKNADDWRQIFVLGIRFYGYGQDGLPVSPNDVDLTDNQVIDPLGTNCLFESFYDILVTGVQFKLGGGATTYKVSATGKNAAEMLRVKNGRLATGAKIVAQNVDGALQSLIKQMNDREKDLKDKKQKEKINVYSIAYSPEAAEKLAPAKLKTQSNNNKNSYASSSAKKTVESNDSKNTEQPNDLFQRFEIPPDMSIVQACEMIVKRSAYLEGAMSFIEENNNQPNPPGSVKPDPKPLMWFTVTANVTKAEWDNVRSDWAYHITYFFETSRIPDMPTAYTSNTNVYGGPVKRYDYFLTGLNSEVIDFKIDFNYLYQNSVLRIPPKDISSLIARDVDETGRENVTAQNTTPGSAPGNNKATTGQNGLAADPTPGSGTNPTNTATYGGLAPLEVGVVPQGPKEGKDALTGAAETSILNYLNDYTAFAHAQLTILGDPDFLIRDTVTTINSLYSRYYDTNGYTISAHGGDIFVEIAIKESRDYIEYDGIMELNENFFFVNYPPYIREICKGALILKANIVHSTFSNGKFTQMIEFMIPSFKGQGAPNADQFIDTNPFLSYYLLAPAKAPDPDLTFKIKSKEEQDAENRRTVQSLVSPYGSTNVFGGNPSIFNGGPVAPSPSGPTIITRPGPAPN